ncbi:BBE domain-containing protein [Streptomyces sp. WG4]|uniref:BBE domain-containing protein n=1 Tax=Streptomyces sp. WG4 TaxID=3417649 RepID=UPI003CE76290
MGEHPSVHDGRELRHCPVAEYDATGTADAYRGNCERLRKIKTQYDRGQSLPRQPQHPTRRIPGRRSETGAGWKGGGGRERSGRR